MLRILAVDISNLFRRNWEAVQGKELSAAFDRTVKAIAALREGFDRVAICCDGGPSFRKALSQQYKANRADPGEGYRDQLRRTIERLEADGCTIFRAPAVLDVQGQDGRALYAEADDTIGALCKWAAEDGHIVAILSGDKDLFQLVTETVNIIRPEGGPPMGPEQVKEKIGVPPALVPDFLALAGDASDGYKPYKGIADTRAVALLQACGSALAVFAPDNLERLDGIVGQANGKTLRDAGAEPCRRALQLATIRCDLDVDFSPLLDEPTTKPIAHGEPLRAESVALAAPEPSRPALVQVERQAAAIISAPRSDPWALQPSGQKGLWQTAEWLANARVFPNLGSPEQIIAATIIAQNLGVPQGLALMHAYVVYGRIGWSAGFIMGLVRRCPECEKFYVAETSDRRATVVFKRRGEPEGRYVFTFEMAERMGVTGPTRKGEPSMWGKLPHVMCRWAAIREAARMVFADVVAGVYMPDEISAGEVPEEMLMREAA